MSPQPPSATRLLWAANAVLPLVPHLRATGFMQNLPQLRQKLQSMLFDFQTRARADGVNPERAAAAVEVLAALLDHVVTSMPWGADAGWESLSPTARARSPAERVLDTVSAPIDAGLRELVGIAVALGFERRLEGPDAAVLDQVRARLGRHAVLPSSKAPVIARRSLLSRWRPLWVSTLVAAAVLAVLYAGLSVSLGQRSDRVYARLAALARPAVGNGPVAAMHPRLSGSLAVQAAAHELSVRDEVDRSVLEIPAPQIFADDGVAWSAAAPKLLRTVADAIEPVAGRVQVIGHTAAGEKRSARYPSDWDWSVARARAVRDALQGLGIAANRLSYDGRAAVEGDAARIEIVVLVGR